MVKTLSRLAPLNKRAQITGARLADVYLAEVVAASHVQGFIVNVTFSDGTNRRIDLEPFLHGPIFEPIRCDRKLFRAIRIQAGTIGWENGADIDPDTLYYEGNPPWATALVTRKAGAADQRRKQRVRPKAKA
jgi:Protein of unknown function (DUF2442)